MRQTLANCLMKRDPTDSKNYSAFTASLFPVQGTREALPSFFSLSIFFNPYLK